MPKHQRHPKRVSITYLAASPVLFAVQRSGQQGWFQREQLFCTSQDGNGKQNSRMMHRCQCWQRSTSIMWHAELVWCHCCLGLSWFDSSHLWPLQFRPNSSANGSCYGQEIRTLVLFSMGCIVFCQTTYTFLQNLTAAALKAEQKGLRPHPDISQDSF